MEKFKDFLYESEMNEEIRHGIPYKNAVADNLDREIGFIEDEELRDFVTAYLDQATPDYFWTTAGAHKKGNHPDQDMGEGGLIRHTKMCVTVAMELLQNELFAVVRQKQDEVIAALICHDTQKNGKDNVKYSQQHSVEGGAAVDEFYKNYEKKSGSLGAKIKTIVKCINNHMGPNYNWRKPYPLSKKAIAAGEKKGPVLPSPDDPFDSFVHLCDYIGSRVFIGDLKYYNDKKFGSVKQSIKSETESFDDHEAWEKLPYAQKQKITFKDFLEIRHPERKEARLKREAEKAEKEAKKAAKKAAAEE